MHVTNKYLQESYKQLNKKYFSNSLPKDMVVVFRRDMDTDGCGRTYFKYGRPLYIEINKRLAWHHMLADFTLLHEMVHVFIPQAEGHGTAFQKQMIRLAKAGAFRYLW